MRNNLSFPTLSHRLCAPACLLVAAMSLAIGAAEVVVRPTLNPTALRNPLKGIRGRAGGQIGDFGTVTEDRDLCAWGNFETTESDGIDKIRAYFDNIWKDYPARNIKGVLCVMLECPGCPSKFFTWPSDISGSGDPKFWPRLLRLIERLGIVLDNDPRLAFIESGFAGSWGEGAFGGQQGIEFKNAMYKAFRNKLVLKNNPAHYEPCLWGSYWWSFAHPGQIGQVDEFLALKNPDGSPRWKTSMAEGEIAYDWGNVASVLGSNLAASLSTPSYYNRLVNCAFRMHASVVGSSGSATVTSSTGSNLFQNSLGYRYVLDTLIYPSSVQTGQPFSVSFIVRNLGSAPMYYAWPVQLALLNKNTHTPVWTAVFGATDIRKWLPGDDWNISDLSDATLATAGHAYRIPASRYHETGAFTIPSSVPNGEYVLALAVLDRDGGMLPNLRFAINNYWQGGYHPMGIIGVGTTPASTAIDPSTFFTGRDDATLHYIVPSPDDTPPSAPTGLSGQATGQSTISLTWNAATDAQSGIREYNVYREGARIATAQGRSYTDQGLSAATTYTYQVSAVNGQVMEGPKSSSISVSTGDDITPPTISLVGAAGASSQVIVIFSEPVEQASAQNAGNYSIDNGINVSAAALGSDLSSVTLTVSTLTKGITYTLTVNNVRDRAATPNTIAPNATAQFQYTDVLTRIRFYPRSGLAGRMRGGVFEATNGDKDNGPYTALHTTTSEPAENQWTEVTSLSNASSSYRYVRYRGPGFCNVAEIEFYRGIEKVNGAVFGTPGSWNNSGDDYTRAFDGDVNTFFDYTSDVGGYTGMDLYGAATISALSVRTRSAVRSGVVVLYDLQGRRIAAMPRGQSRVSCSSMLPGTGVLIAVQERTGAAVKRMTVGR